MKIHKIILLFKYIASVIFSNSLTKINFLFFLDKQYNIDPIGNGHILLQQTTLSIYYAKSD